MESFDVVVIGGGPGGYVSAVRASQLGLKTALTERGDLGGTCVNWGCIPTKALLANADAVHNLKKGRAFGFEVNVLSIDYGAAQKRSQQIAKRQRKRIEALLKANKITVFSDEAAFADNRTLTLKTSGTEIKADNFIIATGSSHRQLPSAASTENILSAKEALALTEVPASVIIIGAGPIGMEFASLWNRYGAEVTVLELMENILITEDAEIAREAETQYRNNGIAVKTGAKVQSVRPVSSGVEVCAEINGRQETLTAEKALIAIGFMPNSRNIGLEALGVALENNGRIIIDGQMRTNIPNIYAIGDVTTQGGLAHTASAQGMAAAEAIAGKKPAPLSYDGIPSCVFGIVEIASVGLTEAQAAAQGYDLTVVKSPFAPNGKALALNETYGFVKLVADKKTDALLGAHIIGPHAAEMIYGPAGMIAGGVGIEQAARVIFPHPTLSEALSEALHALAGHAIHI